MNPMLADENRVLDLDGNGAYVELPARVFDGLAECAVEGFRGHVQRACENVNHDQS